MIGNFARKISGPPRVLDKELDEAHGAPPERFVEKLSDEGGDVYLAPVLESLRAAVRRALHASASEPEAATREAPTEAP